MTAHADEINARLQSGQVRTHLLPVGPEAHVLVSEHGARVYGPFFSDGPSLNWTPEAFSDQHDFADLYASRGWNVGGERIWIGPEIAFMVPDRSDYWGSYSMPPDIDPGHNTLTVDGRAVHVRRRLTFKSYAPPVGRLTLDMGIAVTAAADPLRHVRDIRPHNTVRFAGYRTDVTLSHSEGAVVPFESWNLNQVHGGGTALIPAVRSAQVTDYYEPVGSMLQRIDGGLAVALPGDRRFKIGISATQVYGRLGHLSTSADGHSALVVRHSPVDPSAEYAEEPDFAPGLRGDALHLYDDDGGLGGFAELESRGIPRGGADSRVAGTDRFTTWVYQGPHEHIAPIAQALLGIQLEDLKIKGDT